MWHHLSTAADVKQFVDGMDTFFIDYDGLLGFGPNLELISELFL